MTTTRRPDGSDVNVPRCEDFTCGTLAREPLDFLGRQLDREPRFKGDDELDVFQRVPSFHAGKRRLVTYWPGFVAEQFNYESIELRHRRIS